MITKPINSFTSNSKFDWLKVYFTDKTALQFEIDGEIIGYLAWRLEQNNKVFVSDNNCGVASSAAEFIIFPIFCNKP